MGRTTGESGSLCIQKHHCISLICYNMCFRNWQLSLTQVFLLNGCIPLLIAIPPIWHLNEIYNHGVNETSSSTHSSITENHKQLRQSQSFLGHVYAIWETFQLRAVWKPFIFIFIFSAMQIPNSAWTNFLVIGLKFSTFELGVTNISGSIFGFLGLVLYKQCLFHSGWRLVYKTCASANLVFSLMQVCLALRWNKTLHIPDILFAVGDTALVHLVNGVLLVPTMNLVSYLIITHSSCKNLYYVLSGCDTFSINVCSCSLCCCVPLAQRDRFLHCSLQCTTWQV